MVIFPIRQKVKLPPADVIKIFIMLRKCMYIYVEEYQSITMYLDLRKYKGNLML